MKQIFTLSLVCLLSIGLLSAQSLEFIDPPTSVITRTSGDDTTKTYFNIKNVSDVAVNVKARRIATSFATGMDTTHASFFCWDVCYGTSASASAFSIPIAPGDTTNNAQYIVLTPNDIPGFSTITMRFFVEDSPADFVDYTYEYSVDGVLSLQDKLDLSRVISSPYPNPAKDRASIDYELPVNFTNAEIQVYNLIGKKVRSIPLQGSFGTATIEAAELKSGVYFLYLTAEGKQITSRKLIISK